MNKNKITLHTVKQKREHPVADSIMNFVLNHREFDIALAIHDINCAMGMLEKVSVDKMSDEDIREFGRTADRFHRLFDKIYSDDGAEDCKLSPDSGCNCSKCRLKVGGEDAIKD